MEEVGQSRERISSNQRTRKNKLKLMNILSVIHYNYGKHHPGICSSSKGCSQWSCSNVYEYPKDIR
jgi:hypothetical protein